MKCWRQRKDEELDAEIRSHLDEAIRERMARGETAEQARLNARREFGNVGLVKEVTRAMWGWASLESLWQDARFGARMLRRQKLFTVAAVLCLALGLGANTAIFSLARATLWRALPVAHAERLALVTRGDGSGGNTFSHPDFLALRERNDVLEDLAVCQLVELSFGNGTRSEAIVGELVSGNYFETLGVTPLWDAHFCRKKIACRARIWS